VTHITALVIRELKEDLEGLALDEKAYRIVDLLAALGAELTHLTDNHVTAAVFYSIADTAAIGKVVAP